MILLPETSKSKDFVVYCANADFDAFPKAAEALREKGYRNVWDFEAGLAEWKNAGHDLVGTETT